MPCDVIMMLRGLNVLFFWLKEILLKRIRMYDTIPYESTHDRVVTSQANERPVRRNT